MTAPTSRPVMAAAMMARVLVSMSASSAGGPVAGMRPMAGLGEHLALMAAGEPGGEIVVHRHGLLLPVRAVHPAASHLLYERVARDPTGCRQKFSSHLRRSNRTQE
jgi:hypothetical protein